MEEEEEEEEEEGSEEEEEDGEGEEVIKLHCVQYNYVMLKLKFLTHYTFH